ncbi:CD276 antigen-like [Astyanax mexicanus]|uniref:CD276 antigen-like n=1 Tax=Astyanax mexicanus TaxID=7994 RepID=A0A8T2MKJ8_ASTMX|nr:CD276 antigen-like [Astyanax mexicanus]
MIHLFWMVFACLVRKVQHPLSTVTVAPGGNATLGCSFSASLNINSLIVNWQYGDTVVHSFYLGKDQLERQGANYRGRTYLFKEELLKGNASLLLTAVRSEDVGDYTCHITNEQGSTSEKIKVILAAPFDEPLLSLQPTCDSINITVTVSNGYPEPEFKWHDSSGRELNQTQSSVLLDSRGRYQVSSTINFQSNSIETISVEIKLEVLNQNIIRSLLLHPPPEYCQDCCQVTPTSRGGVSVVFSFLLFIVLVILILCLIKYNKKSSDGPREQEHTLAEPSTSTSL